ncbi:nuclear transport factor 2 family protein [Novosphingobium sp. BW1]|uniref:nuclear transport factor 2 family protein n=1 Tax=Novosphingobium sp. BW1 TaxID=2592621 RepID=UPI0011DE9BFA|nr:nuclear transport factor 2 family protein [Novosphingobium sp. BW1]TYC84985.1 nuclear transport factor 2 family protein [Novosphingobium sp. BW1]
MSAGLSPETVRAIEHDCAKLVARYANRNDAADWEAVVALYAKDGRMARPSAPDDWIEGQDAILAAFTARPARTTRHVCSNVEITVLDADTAIGESAMLLFTGEGAPKIGSFEDRFVRTAQGWKFAERRGLMTF